MKAISLLYLFLMPLFVTSQVRVVDYDTDKPELCGGIEKIFQMKGSWKKSSDDLAFPDKTFPKSQYNLVYARTNRIFSLFKEIFPDPGGFDPIYYTSIRGQSFTLNGPLTYQFTSMYFIYYCNDNVKKVLLGDETGTEVKIYINHYNHFCDTLESWDIRNDKKLIKIYTLPPKAGTWKGRTLYNTGRNSLAVVLAHNGKLPWYSLTQREYLNGLRNKYHSELKRKLDSYEEQEIMLRNRKPPSNLSPELTTKIRDQFDKDLDLFLKNKEKYKAATRKVYEDELRYIDAYFASASESTLNKKAIIHPKTNSLVFKGEFGDDNSNGTMLIAFSSAYFNNSLPRYVPQFMILHWKWQYDQVSANIKRNFEQNFPLEKLKALIDATDLPPNPEADQPIQPKQYLVKKMDRTNIDRIVDSMFRNHKVILPELAGGIQTPAKVTIDEVDLPSPNNKKILLASRKLETREELIRYIDELETKLAPLLTSTASYGSTVKNNDASFGNWLAVRPKEALTLAIKAAKQEPDNNTLLNNLGATISLCGIDYMAVPLYIVCLKKEPDNSTITNNLGQAYLSIGEVSKAESFLKKAVSSSPYHHHANNSLGLLYLRQGRKDEAIKCFENSLRGSFTLTAFNKLKVLKSGAGLKLMDYIRHRYKQPDYINFNKYPIPLQCISIEQTEKRKAEHKAYQKIIDDQLTRYTKLRDRQKPVADSSLRKVFFTDAKTNPKIKPFMIFAQAVIVSVRTQQDERIFQLKKDVLEDIKEWKRLRMEYDSAMKQMYDSFEPRLEKEGEGNVDPTLEDEICGAKKAIANHYLPLLAKVNEDKFSRIIRAHKDYLNDYLYWIRLASFTQEQYQLEYYETIISLLKLLRLVELTTLEDFCGEHRSLNGKSDNINIKQPDCPLPVGIEIPFIIAKISLDCESWGIEGGEILKINITHKIGAETTIAFGAGESFYTTPKLGKDAFDLNPGLDVNAKGQLFITFDGNAVLDGGFLWEAEIDLVGIGKPVEAKQNFTWSINKGFTAEGPLSSLADKLLDVPTENQLNKNVKIYKLN